MNGPEHYREAERLLAASGGPNASAEWIAACQGAAQVHATLALVAVHANTKAVAEFPLVQRPDGYDAPEGTLTWPEVIQ